MKGLTEVEIKVWRAGSDIQRERPKGAPPPTFREIGDRAGVSRTSAANAIRTLQALGVVERYGEQRSVFFKKLAPKPKQNASGSAAAD